MAERETKPQPPASAAPSLSADAARLGVFLPELMCCRRRRRRWQISSGAALSLSVLFSVNAAAAVCLAASLTHSLTFDCSCSLNQKILR